MDRGLPLGALTLLVLSATPAAAQPSATPPAAAVGAFYHYHFAHDMAFTRGAVRRRAQWLSPDLLRLCRAYFARPDRVDEPPAIDGDPFTDSQEYPSSFRVDAATTSGDTTLVPVVLSWKTGEQRRVSVAVVRHGRAWLVADLRYESGQTFRDLLTLKP